MMCWVRGEGCDVLGISWEILVTSIGCCHEEVVDRALPCLFFRLDVPFPSFFLKSK